MNTKRLTDYNSMVDIKYYRKNITKKRDIPCRLSMNKQTNACVLGWLVGIGGSILSPHPTKNKSGGEREITIRAADTYENIMERNEDDEREKRDLYGGELVRVARRPS